MNDIYDVLKSVISAGGYKLAEMQRKIKKLYTMGDLTDEQMDELMALSQQMANPEAERPETMKMLRDLSERISAVEKKLAAEDGTQEEQPEHEQWVQPIAGLTDDYQYGAITAHVGKVWRSEFKGQNVWEPGAPGTENIWVEITPETEE